MHNYLLNANINDLQEHLLLNLLGKYPFEFFTETTAYLPKWINFSILDILYDLNLIPNEKNLDGKTLRDKLYLSFIEYLIYLEVPLSDFLNYTSLFDIEKENRKIYYVLLEKFATKYVMKELTKYSNFLLAKFKSSNIFTKINFYTNR